MHQQRAGHGEGGQEAGGEQRGDRGIGDAAINDHGQAGRHQYAHAGRGGDDGAGPGAAVAALLHAGDHHGTDGRGIRVGGAGDAGKQHHRQHDHIAQAALDVADHGGGEDDQAAGDAAGFHQLPGQDEERDGEEGEAVDGAEGAAGDDVEWHALHQPQPDGGATAKREADGHGQRHEGGEGEQRRDHAASSWRNRPATRWNSISAAPTGMAR